MDKCLAFWRSARHWQCPDKNSPSAFTSARIHSPSTIRNWKPAPLPVKKKKSPSQIRREARRREEWNQKKLLKPTEKVVDDLNDATKKPEAISPNADSETFSEIEKTSSLGFKCKECEYKTATEKELQVHSKKKHIISQLDGALSEDVGTEADDSNIDIVKKRLIQIRK